VRVSPVDRVPQNRDEFDLRIELLDAPRSVAKKIRSATGSHSEIVFVDRPVNDPQARCPDISLAPAELGWEPRVPLTAGLRKTIAWARRAWRLPSASAGDRASRLELTSNDRCARRQATRPDTRRCKRGAWVMIPRAGRARISSATRTPAARYRCARSHPLRGISGSNEPASGSADSVLGDEARGYGMYKGLPVIGSAMILHLTPKISSTRDSVTSPAGEPSAETRPSFSATR